MEFLFSKAGCFSSRSRSRLDLDGLRAERGHFNEAPGKIVKGIFYSQKRRFTFREKLVFTRMITLSMRSSCIHSSASGVFQSVVSSTRLPLRRQRHWLIVKVGELDCASQGGVSDWHRAVPSRGAQAALRPAMWHQLWLDSLSWLPLPAATPQNPAATVGSPLSTF